MLAAKRLFAYHPINFTSVQKLHRHYVAKLKLTVTHGYPFGIGQGRLFALDEPEQKVTYEYAIPVQKSQ